MARETKASPPWGAFPVEQYLIVNRPPSPSPAATIDHCIFPAQLGPLLAALQPRSNPRVSPRMPGPGQLPGEWDTIHRRPPQPPPRVPTDDEVRTILAPWRPARWRDAAAQLWRNRYDHAVWLRKHYGEGSDAQFRAWRDADEDNNPNFEEEETAWLVFDDPHVFDVGDEWWRALDVVPELAHPGYKNEAVPAVREQLRERIRARVADGEDAEEVAVWEAEYGEHGNELQVQSVSSFLLVADARTWETESLRLLFLDKKGNIVRHRTVEVEHAWETSAFWIARKFRDTGWWQFDSERETGVKLGDAYRAHGEQGRLLYGLDL